MSISLPSVLRIFAHKVVCVSNLPSNSIFKTVDLCSFQNNTCGSLFCRILHVSSKVLKIPVAPNLSDNKKKQNSEVKKPTSKPKKEKQTYITLIGLDNNISVTTHEDALKISVRRDLRLIKVKDYDAKTERPTYQLVTTSQYLKEDIKENEVKEKKESFLKGEKTVSLSHKINENDLNNKINMMKKWVAKRYEVRVVITGDDPNSRDTIYKAVESKLKDESRIVQKREKGLDTRFQLIPFKKVETSSQS